MKYFRFLCLIGLKFLVRLCTDQGLERDVQEFAVKLKKAEKSKELREQVETAIFLAAIFGALSL